MAKAKIVPDSKDHEAALGFAPQVCFKAMFLVLVFGLASCSAAKEVPRWHAGPPYSPGTCTHLHEIGTGLAPAPRAAQVALCTTYKEFGVHTHERCDLKTAG